MSSPSFLTRMRFALAGVSYKAAALPIVPRWMAQSFLTPSFERLTREGYTANAAVYACVSALAFAFPAAPLQVLSLDEEPLPDHPLQRLLKRPNPVMSEATLAQYVMPYMAIGGNAYLYKVRNSRGEPVELWPYHAGQVTPVPGQREWIDHYEYDAGDGIKIRLPREDVVHLRWPLPDMKQPWLGQPPLRAVSAEVDTDNELTRYLYALLANDAMPRSSITLPPGVTLSDDQFERLRDTWYSRHGANGRGGVAFLEGGARVERIGLNMQELAFDALRRVPEARIAAAFRVPAMFVGLNVGLERSTYSNMAEARDGLIKDTMAPLWQMIGDEIEQSLGMEFGGDLIVRHDLSRVQALQEDENEKYARIVSAWDSGLLMLNEGRAELGFEPVADGDVFKSDARAPEPEPEPQVTIEQPAQPALEAQDERLEAEQEKGFKAVDLAPFERQIERIAAEILADHYRRAAEVATSG